MSAPSGSGSATAARRVAHEVVRRTFEQGAWTDRAFAAATGRFELDAREQAQARRLTYGAVQRRGTTDHLIGVLARRRLERIDPPALAALRIGLYELLFSDHGADHAAVDQAVELTRQGFGQQAGSRRARAASGFVNALLRRAATEGGELVAALDDSTPDGAAVAHSYPPWLARMWWEELGPVEARLAMAAMNEPAEAAFRVNTLLADPERVAADLSEAGVEVERGSGADLLQPRLGLVAATADERVGSRVAAGELVPQSRGSQAVVELLDPQPGDRVLDLCAAPGIKTTAIAARIGASGELVSFESNAGRAEELARLCERTGAGAVRIEVADAAEADLGSGYDRILLDPPCSDLGTLASRPDARWRKTPELRDRLARLQRRLLVRAGRALAPGGTLVYSTCTVSATENETVAAELEGYAPELAPDALGELHPRLASRRDPRFLQLLPQRDRTSGFFIARYRCVPG